jgi:hypothetical protein
MFARVIVALLFGIAFPYAELIGKVSAEEQEADSSEGVPF